MSSWIPVVAGLGLAGCEPRPAPHAPGPPPPDPAGWTGPPGAAQPPEAGGEGPYAAGDPYADGDPYEAGDPYEVGDPYEDDAPRGDRDADHRYDRRAPERERYRRRGPNDERRGQGPRTARTERPEPEPQPEPEPPRRPAAEPAPAKRPPSPPPAKGSDRAKPKEPGGRLAGILGAHNRARARHCAPPLRWSDKVAATARAWAQRLREAGCAFDHNPRTRYGENLAMFSPSGGAADRAVAGWYDEHELYDYSRPGFSFETGHFTQVVWSDTKELGCAVVECRGADIWVCNYHPAGNVEGQYDDNVKPPSCR